jgi:hypothetical protein
MDKTIEIGGKSITFSADGALPIVYRQLFPKKSFFTDITKVESEPEIIIDFAFAMAYNADKKRTGTNETLWLKSVSKSPYELIEHGDEFAELLTENEAGTSDLKELKNAVASRETNEN